MHKTYIDRANTNKEVYRRANLEMGLGAEKISRPLSDILQYRNSEEKFWGISSEEHETTHDTKPLLLQELFCHNKLKIEGWVAQERSGRMKQWKIAGA